MAVRLDKPWISFSPENVARLPCHLGVYQLANAAGEILFVGIAGGRSRFGLRSELQAWRDGSRDPGNEQIGATRFRFEVNMAYWSRRWELLAAFVHDHGRLPIANTDVDLPRLGRLRPGGPD